MTCSATALLLTTITLLLSVASPVAVSVEGPVVVVSVENCSHLESPVLQVPSGTCAADPRRAGVGSWNATCHTEPQQCATLVWYLDERCTVSPDALTTVCGQCIHLTESESLVSTPVRVTCDPVTQNVTLEFNCTASCSQCFGAPATVPLLQCADLHLSWKNTPMNQYVFHQGLSVCPTLQLTTFPQSASCDSSPTSIRAVVPQSSCTASSEFWACTPNPVDLVPPRFDTLIFVESVKDPVTYAVSCSTNSSEFSFAFDTGTCTSVNASLSALFGVSGALSAVATTVATPQQCADIVRFNGSVCAGASQAFTVVCGSCVWTENEFVYVVCNATAQTVLVSTGCDSSCSTCMNPNLVSFLLHACGEWNGSAAFHRGLFPCNAARLALYSSATVCSPTTLLHETKAAMDRCSAVNGFFQGFSSYAQVQSCGVGGRLGDESALVIAPGACVPSSYGGEYFQQIDCRRESLSSQQCVEFELYLAGGKCRSPPFLTAALVCNACAMLTDPTSGRQEAAYVACGGPGNSTVVLYTNCSNSTCALCSTTTSLSLLNCSTNIPALSGVGIKLTRILPCNGAMVSVFNASNGTCEATERMFTIPVPQDMCLPMIGVSIHCVTGAEVLSHRTAVPPLPTTTVAPTSSSTPVTTSEQQSSAPFTTPLPTTTVPPSTASTLSTTTTTPTTQLPFTSTQLLASSTAAAGPLTTTVTPEWSGTTAAPTATLTPHEADVDQRTGLWVGVAGGVFAVVLLVALGVRCACSQRRGAPVHVDFDAHAIPLNSFDYFNDGEGSGHAARGKSVSTVPRLFPAHQPSARFGDADDASPPAVLDYHL